MKRGSVPVLVKCHRASTIEKAASISRMQSSTVSLFYHKMLSTASKQKDWEE